GAVDHPGGARIRRVHCAEAAADHEVHGTVAVDVAGGKAGPGQVARRDAVEAVPGEVVQPARHRPGAPDGTDVRVRMALAGDPRVGKAVLVEIAGGGQRVADAVVAT